MCKIAECCYNNCNSIWKNFWFYMGHQHQPPGWKSCTCPLLMHLLVNHVTCSKRCTLYNVYNVTLSNWIQQHYMLKLFTPINVSLVCRHVPCKHFFPGGQAGGGLTTAVLNFTKATSCTSLRWRTYLNESILTGGDISMPITPTTYSKPYVLHYTQNKTLEIASSDVCLNCEWNCESIFFVLV